MRIQPNFWRGVDRICWPCVLMEDFVGTNSLKYAPLLMSGMTSILNAPVLQKARQAMFNLRQISLAYTTESSIQHAVTMYDDYYYRNQTEGVYQINSETLEFQRTDPLEDPLITQAKDFLSQPLPYQKQAKTFADLHKPIHIALGEDKTAVRIPIEPFSIPIQPQRVHDLHRLPKGKITIPLDELKEIALEMDRRDKQKPERSPGNWLGRYNHFELKIPEIGKGLKKGDTIELEGLKHLIGLPGSGKTTLLMLIAVWLGKKGYKTMFVFPSIEVSQQYMVDLAFHGVKVGLLVGQSKLTQKKHADKLAEAIAVTGTNKGFAYTLAGADHFARNCVLSAFSKADTSLWEFGYAPCRDILQSSGKDGGIKEYLCPLWTMCGRNKAPRELIDTDIWVGHILSMDTEVSPQALNERIRYFELIARTFDVVIFDEADMVQDNLDEYGAVELKVSGAEDSMHNVILEQIHQRFARGETYRLFDREVEIYSRDVAEFGNHNFTLIAAVQKMESRISQRYENQLLSPRRIISDLLDGLDKDSSARDRQSDEEVKKSFNKQKALTEFWYKAAYEAFYNRTELSDFEWDKADLYASKLGVERKYLIEDCKRLFYLFRNYLSENSLKKRDGIIKNIETLFLRRCYPNERYPRNADDVIILLVCVTFMIFGYKKIINSTRNMIAEGLIQESALPSSPSQEFRKVISENILGLFSGVKYSFSKATSTRANAKNVELSYITFMGSPRTLLYHFHELYQADNYTSPAVLLTSATSFLEPSPSYHINISPHYLLKPKSQETKSNTEESRYIFKWFPDPAREKEPLRFSGAGELRNRNLQEMVKALVKDGEYSEINKAIYNFDLKYNIHRKAALVVNSYEQVRILKKYLNDFYPEVGKRTKAIVSSLREGEQSNDFVTPAQCPVLGDDENCDILIFPIKAIGRGVNIVFTKGLRERDAAIGSIYFLTRPHPTIDNMQLLYSLAAKATQDFDQRIFSQTDNLESINKTWQEARKDFNKQAYRLLREPLMASRLGEELFQPFTANQMVDILQVIGRGMRNSCPVQVYFVDAAWAIKSTNNQPDSERDSMLVKMKSILEECIRHPDPVIQEIYQELYESFLKPLKKVKGVVYGKSSIANHQTFDEDDDFYESFDYLEM